jgi:hypothetical protein
MGVVAVFAICVGFGRTYAAPMMRGTFVGPRILHVHGALALAWVLLFVAQPLLVRWRAFSAHRRLGYVGLPLALAVAGTMIPAGLYSTIRDSDAGLGSIAISPLLGVITSAILFVALVTAGVVARRDREAHSRWLLLATLLVIWPAWFRFRHWFPQVPHPDFWFGVVLPMAWVMVAIIRDRVVRGAVHPVLLFAGTGLILEQGFELFAFDTPLWRATANALFVWLRP